MTDLIIKTACLDTTTLASQTSTILDDTMKDFKEAILLTKMKTEINGDWPNISADSVIIGLAYGDATNTQIAAVMSTAVVNVEDGQAYREGQVATRAVIDFVALKPPHTAGDTMAQSIKWDLPKGGLPAAKGSGFRLFLYNVSDINPFTNGPKICATTKWWYQRLSS